jgi:hypothetical protein
MCLCFCIIAVLSEGVQTSLCLHDIFIPCVIQSSFSLCVLLYLTGKLASKIFRKVLRNEFNIQLTSLGFDKQIPSFLVLVVSGSL